LEKKGNGERWGRAHPGKGWPGRQSGRKCYNKRLGTSLKILKRYHEGRPKKNFKGVEGEGRGDERNDVKSMAKNSRERSKGASDISLTR